MAQLQVFLTRGSDVVLLIVDALVVARFICVVVLKGTHSCSAFALACRLSCTRILHQIL